MSIIEIIQDQAWAIYPSKLDEIVAFIEMRTSDGKQVLSEDFASGKSGNRAEDNYEIRNGVAVIPVFGTLTKRANIFTKFSGGTSYQLLQRDIGAALNDPNVKSIVLEIDSPGGTADGAFEISNYIFSMRGKKPILAVSDGMMASAAYLIGSAADQIFVGPATYSGSIGVVSAHFDYSRQDEKTGVKRTYIYAGKYKAMGNDSEPLNDESKQYLQDKVDYLYDLFLQIVARNRNVDQASALSMADGKIFIGEQAIGVGLADSVGTVDDAVESARRDGSKFRMKGQAKMNIEQLKAEHPELFNQVHKLGADSIHATMEEEKAKAKAEGLAEGAASERARVSEILSAKGDPTVAKEAIDKGLSVGDAFKLFFKAEKDNKAAALKELQESLDTSAGAQGKKKDDKTGPNFLAEVGKYQADNKCSRTEALRAVSAKEPKLYEAYRESLVEADKK